MTLKERPKNTFFVTGIGTDVGKTIASAILVEALKADYWKPIQAGDLDHSDTHKVKALITNPKTIVHDNSYALQTPMSPHAAAEIDEIRIITATITPPQTENNLVIEGAGGLLVPLNDKETILDLIHEDYKVIVVSRHYLGSINHTLMTIRTLEQQGHSIAGIIFNGNPHPSTESIILKMTGIQMIGRIKEETHFDQKVIKTYASKFKKTLALL